MKKFKILSLILIIVLALGLFPVSASALDDPTVSASAAVLMNADTGDILFEKNGSATVQPASTTKMMTALLVVEAIEDGTISLTDEVTAYQDCQYNMEDDSSNANPAIEPGEIMTVEDLLYCAMLQSANEACNILAEYVSGSISDFVELMNQRAEELGCTGTHFSNTNGLEASDHYTTAEDFAIIAKEAVTHAMFLTVCGAASYTVDATNMAEARSLTNTNQLLISTSDYYYAYAYGIKTGYFSNAGYCLVSAANYNDMNVICVVMGSTTSNGQFADTLTLYDWVFSNYSYVQLLSSTETLIASVPVEMGTTDSTGARASSAVTALLPSDYDTSDLEYRVTLYYEQEGESGLEAPVNAGDVIGEVSVVLNGEVYGTSSLVVTYSVEMSRANYLRSQIKSMFQEPVVRRIITILIILLAAYILLVVFYRIQRRRHVRSVRQAKRDRAIAQAERETEWLDIPAEKRKDPSIGYFDDRSRDSRDSYDEDGYDDEDYDEYDDGYDDDPPPTSRNGRDDYFDSFFRH
ncbi:MAG: D-alanyl-D-alanine carboxypeptidase [Oscillospiraceae bacterium]|nr:D-alanyl-D-alanine carboxypeptidase [Oscillospiraceae bacterium]